MIDLSKATISNLFFEQFRNLTLESMRKIYGKSKKAYDFSTAAFQSSNVNVMLER